MTIQEQHRALSSAISAAHLAGALMKRNLHGPKKIDSQQQHDIKLELDVRCQKRIEERLAADFPEVAVLGEEGSTGSMQAASRWVIDPIDGTVNFTYGVPHACVSIALQILKPRTSAPKNRGQSMEDSDYETVVGVVYDPFVDEIWTAIRGQPARLNGKAIRVSKRRRLDESIVAIGFAKQVESLDAMLPVFNQLIRRVRKMRLMGAAALSMTYVASGRFDAYVESGVSLWDIAAGGLILECAGGEFWREPVPGEHKFRIVANNGLLRRKLEMASR
ncbi:MAG: inositol monophosphatase family protein [Verrucomicrobiota bacterium]